MRHFASIAIVLVAVGSTVPASHAEPMVFLTSPDDLSSIQVGQDVQIDVRLQGLDFGNEFIFVLNTKVLFPTALFDLVPDPSWTSGLTPGEVSGTDPSGTAPDGLFIAESQRDNFDALSSFDEGTGVVTGNFSDSSPDTSVAINQNGLFYSFTLRALGVGSGTIAFAGSDNAYASNLTGFNLEPLPTGAALAFSVVVPEPSTVALMVFGCVLPAGLAWRRSRRPRPEEALVGSIGA